MVTGFRKLMSVVMVSGSFNAIAADDFFSEIEVDLESKQKPAPSPPIDSKATIKQIVKYGLETPLEDYGFNRTGPGLSQVQTDFFIQLRRNINSNVGLQFSTKAEADWMQWQQGELDWRSNHEKIFIKDAFADLTTSGGIWLRAGHQIIAWGLSQNFLPITDILSPMDLREPGQAELRDIREHITALSLSFPFEHQTITLVATYQAGHNRYADSAEDFYPYSQLKANGVDIDFPTPNQDWESALRWEYRFNGGDLSLVAADINDNTLALTKFSSDFSTAFFTQERVQMVGVALSQAKSSWVFKAEAGYFHNQPVNNHQNLPWQEYNEWRGFVGFDYHGWNNCLISVELNASTLSPVADSNSVDDPNRDRDPYGMLMYLRYAALNDRLENQLWFIHLVGDEGSVWRWHVNYDLTDYWRAGAGVVIYQSEIEGASLYPFQHHDSVNLTLEYNF